jgi:hypothetical protein
LHDFLLGLHRQEENRPNTAIPSAAADLLHAIPLEDPHRYMLTSGAEN